MIRAIPRTIWVAILFLAISALLLFVSKASQVVNPSADSYAPSGLKAFADLLRAEGYRVRLDKSPIPRLGKDDVAIAVFLDDSDFWGVEPDEQDTGLSVEKTLGDHFNGGGAVILSSVPSDSLPSPRAFSSTVVPLLGKPTREAMIHDTDVNGVLDDWDECLTFIESWKVGSAAVATLHLFEDGGLLHEVSDATGATNRFVDQQDNAAFWLDIVRAAAGPESEIVFVEAASGNVQSTGLLEALGPGATLAWAQVLVLLALIAFTLGKPFGLPDVSRVAQKGGRDLADALAAVLGRSKKFDAAMEVLHRQVDRRTRNRSVNDPIPEPPKSGTLKDALAYARDLEDWEKGVGSNR